MVAIGSTLSTGHIPFLIVSVSSMHILNYKFQSSHLLTFVMHFPVKFTCTECDIFLLFCDATCNRLLDVMNEEEDTASRVCTFGA